MNNDILKKLSKQLNAKIAILLSLVFSLALASCQKPKERQATLDKNTSSKVIEISLLTDYTAESEAIIMNKFINNIKDSKLQNELRALLANDQLYFTIDDNLFTLFKLDNLNSENAADTITDAETTNDVATDVVADVSSNDANTDSTNAEADSITVKGFDVDADIADQSTTQESILVKIPIVYGTLKNQRTDYDEKMSTLKFIETDYAEATHILIGDAFDASL